MNNEHYPHPRTSGDMAAENYADAANSEGRWGEFAGDNSSEATNIPVSIPESGPYKVTIHAPTAAEVVGATNGKEANPGELPAVPAPAQETTTTVPELPQH